MTQTNPREHSVAAEKASVELGLIMGKLRKAAGQNQTDTAEELDMSVPTIRSFETGKGGKLVNLLMLMSEYGILEEFVQKLAELEEAIEPKDELAAEKWLGKKAASGEPLNTRDAERALIACPGKEHPIKPKTANRMLELGYAVRRGDDGVFVATRAHAEQSEHQYGIRVDGELQHIGRQVFLVVGLARGQLTKTQRRILELEPQSVIKRLDAKLSEFDIHIKAFEEMPGLLQHQAYKQNGEPITSAVINAIIGREIDSISDEQE